MSKISEVEKDLSKWRKSKNGHRGKLTPEHIRKQVVELLSEYSAWDLQKRLGINVNALKSWKDKYSSGQFFIPLPAKPEKKEMISKGSRGEIFPVNLSLKISFGEWCVEGNLSLKDWESAISLLGGVR